MPSKYPLQPLLEHRERAVDDRTAELGGAIGARETAEQQRARAEALQDAAEREAAGVRNEEASLLKEGQLQVGDLARGHAWEVGAQARLDALARATASATATVATARDAEHAARGALAGAMADRDVVQKDADKFTARATAKQLAAEEEQAEDVHRGRKQ